MPESRSPRPSDVLVSVLLDDPTRLPEPAVGLATDPDTPVFLRQRIAAHPLGTPELIAELIVDPEPQVRATALRNPACPPDLLVAHIADEDDFSILTGLASQQTDASVLVALTERAAALPPAMRAPELDLLANALLENASLPDPSAARLVAHRLAQLPTDTDSSDDHDARDAIHHCWIAHPHLLPVFAEQVFALTGSNRPYWAFCLFRRVNLDAPRTAAQKLAVPEMTVQRIHQRLFEIALLEPLAALANHPARPPLDGVLSDRIYACSDDLLVEAQRTALAAATLACNTADSRREEYFRTRFAPPPPGGADRALIVARTSSSPLELANLVEEWGRHHEIMLAVIDNRSASTSTAVAARASLSIGSMSAAVAARQWDVEYLAATIAAVPGMARELTGPSRREILVRATTLILAGERPRTNRNNVDIATDLVADLTAADPSALLDLPVDTVFRLSTDDGTISFIPSLTELLCTALSDLDATALRIALTLADDFDGTLGELLETARSIHAPVPAV